MARDGVEVPVSLLYRKGTPRDGSAPLYLYGYGAYGATMDPYFRTTILSMVDRGFVYAIAHIRGGAELGYHWYESGKLRNRTNTFNDFVDVARNLIQEQYSAAGRIAIAGGSAGGSLMGAAINQAPDLWGAVAAHVPFVDIVNTMLDDSLPLTPIEWPEWGNPIENKEDLEYILSYSPYDQLKAVERPSRDVLGTGEMGRKDPTPEAGQQSTRYENRNGCWSRRSIWSLRFVARGRRGIRVYSERNGIRRLTSAHAGLSVS